MSESPVAPLAEASQKSSTSSPSPRPRPKTSTDNLAGRPRTSARRRGRPHGVERREPSIAWSSLTRPSREDDVDLLGCRVTMREGLALPRLDGQIVEPRLVGAEVGRREARFLGRVEPVLERSPGRHGVARQRRHVTRRRATLSRCRTTSARTAKTARSTSTGKEGLSDDAVACRRCGFGFLFELMDDYYPAPTAGLVVCDQQGRILAVGRGVFELTGYSRGRPDRRRSRRRRSGSAASTTRTTRRSSRSSGACGV